MRVCRSSEAGNGGNDQRGLHQGPSEGSKPTPVTDHQGAATPPADCAYLRDLLYTRIHLHSHGHGHVYTCVRTRVRTHTGRLVRANDSNVPREAEDGGLGRTRGAQWRSSNYSPTRTHVLPPRVRNGLKDRGEERERRRNSVDSIIVGSAPKICLVQISTPTRPDRVESSRGPRATGVPGTRRTLCVYEGRD